MKKVALVSLGCAKNLVDSEVMLGFLERNGYDPVPDPGPADVVVVNTCGFIRPAREEAMSAIREAVRWKRKGKKKVVVAGCYVQRSRPELQALFPEVDAWIGVGDYDKIAEAIEGKPFRSSAGCYLYDHLSPRRISTPPAWAYVKISEGCSHRCSFCSIPLIKGPYRSRNMESIVKEIRELTSSGIREINLVSQDSTYYGRDRKREGGLARLLGRLLEATDVDWIRVLYGYPEEISDELLEVMAEERICSYLDIPFQHSHPSIVKSMGRSLDGNKALGLLEKIRTRLPGVAVRTSLVVGFPGEGKEEFDHLVRFVREARFDHMGVFTYSPEEGTIAFALGDPVKESVKKRRKEKLLDIQAEISYADNARYLGRTVDVLVEGTLKQDPGVVVARGTFQAPEVDGVVLIRAGETPPEVFNSIRKVEITDRDVYDLAGTWA